MGGTLVAEGPAHARRFHFELDFVLPADEGSVQAAGGLQGLRGRRVLLVDGHAPSLQTLAEAARAIGLEVEVAHDGWDAMRAAAMAMQAGRAFEFAVVDLQLPGMEGAACARQLLETTEAAAPLLLMTTVAAREGALASLRAQGLPVREVLVKPVGSERLAQACLAGLSRPAAPPARDTPVPPDSRSLAGMRLLLVDDNLINQELASDMLHRAGAQVTVAGNGQEALDALSTLAFDGVLMDLQMPVMDGYEATRAIRAQPRWRDLPIIAMTASAQPRDRERVLAAGMNDHVAKPVDPQRLVAALVHAVGAQAAPRPVTPLTAASVPSVGAGATAAASSRPADESLDRLPGIDAGVGRANTMGNDRLYRRLLLKFREAQHDAPERLQAAWNDGDHPTARRVAHDLAGVAGTLGAMGVHLAARAIEAVCAGEAPAGTLPVLVETLREELSPVIDGLRPLGGE
jgi:CheY-like chemotaxis protein/HPt (histidine-containing phosphotransfer) domain-containing protein